MDKKGNAAAIVLDFGKPKKGDSGGDDEEMDSSSKESAAGALLDAIDAKDKAGIVDALSTMYDLCASGKMSDSEGDEEGG
jgi:hypothetical protein